MLAHQQAGSLFSEADPESALGICFNENYRCVQYQDKQIYFSFARRGNAMSCHFSASRQDLRLIRTAIEDFTSWIYQQYPWCNMILAAIQRPSVKRLVQRAGFEHVTDAEGKSIYMRAK